MIAKLAREKRGMEVVGHGALRNTGRVAKSDVVLTTSGLKGVTLYEPTELVMSARAGTPLFEIEAVLAARGQMLAFEPIDLGPATGAPGGALSIGGVFATNFSGSRRISAGSARDNLLGVRAVNGRAELFKSGGRVMKNVTGLDVARGLTGSWGTLAVMTEVTFKVAPLPQTMQTLAFLGLPDDLAIEALTVAMKTPLEVSGAVHLPKNCAARIRTPKLKGLGQSLTLLRLETFVGCHRPAKREAQGRAQSLRRANRARSGGNLQSLERVPIAFDDAVLDRYEPVAHFNAADEGP